MPTLNDLGEFEAIRRLAAAGGFARGASGVIVGTGDDAAVLRPAQGCDVVATTDAFVEGRHFDVHRMGPAEIGARLAAACLSDVAAMAARPRWAIHALGVRGGHDAAALVELQGGLSRALEADGAAIVGGNLTAVEGAEWLSLTVLGEVARDHAWTRAGARPGDAIAVTGWPGRAGAGWLLARRPAAAGAGASPWQPLLDAYYRPRSRVALALALAETRAVRAAIDVSDGLTADLFHLCEASGTSAELDADALGGDTLLARAAAALGLAPERLALGPSDDYELLLALDPAGRTACETLAAAAGVPLRVIGRITPGPPKLTRLDPKGERRPLPPSGFDHFGPAGHGDEAGA